MSEVRNARRGVIGGFLVVSGAVRCCGWAWAVIPARALSRCCASMRFGANVTGQRTKSSELAGECGNRTHPTLRRKVTVILKITEATRPHPPPLFSLNFDRNFSPVDDLADDCRSS